MRQVVLYPDEDGYWVVECPSLPGCISQGKTKAEALENIKDAIQLWIDDATEYNEAVPVEVLKS
jgi:predicted RNase H-like HicB family nuclease